MQFRNIDLGRKILCAEAAYLQLFIITEQEVLFLPNKSALIVIIGFFLGSILISKVMCFVFRYFSALRSILSL